MRSHDVDRCWMDATTNDGNEVTHIHAQHGAVMSSSSYHQVEVVTSECMVRYHGMDHQLIGLLIGWFVCSSYHLINSDDYTIPSLVGQSSQCGVDICFLCNNCLLFVFDYHHVPLSLAWTLVFVII